MFVIFSQLIEPMHDNEHKTLIEFILLLLFHHIK